VSEQTQELAQAKHLRWQADRRARWSAAAAREDILAALPEASLANVRFLEPCFDEVEIYNLFVRLVRDETGQLYLLGFCDGVVEQEEYCPEEGYERLDLALPLSSERLEALEAGELNLRDAYSEPEQGELGLALRWPSGRVQMVMQPADEVFFQFLPGPLRLRRAHEEQFFPSRKDR
jgi:hypothetical protein